MELHIGLVSRVARTEHFIDFLSSQSLGWYCFFPINVRFLFLLSSLFCNQGMCAGRGSRNIFQLLSWLSDPRLLYSLPVLEIPRPEKHTTRQVLPLWRHGKGQKSHVLWPHLHAHVTVQTVINCYIFSLQDPNEIDFTLFISFILVL